MSARKIGFLVLILVFGASLEIAWNIRESTWAIGPEGCRVLGGRFYGPSFTFDETAERELPADLRPRLEVTNAFGNVQVLPGEGSKVRVTLRKVVFQPTEEQARSFARRLDLRIEQEGELLRVETNREDVARESRVGFETHLEIHVPPDTSAVVRSDHGRVEARGIAGADVRATFDDVRVEEIAGPVTIDARQGAVEAVGLGAGLGLKLRHGEADVTDVAGRTEVDLQHGQLRLRRSAGLRARVSFAELSADDIEGDVVVDGRRTALHVSDVTGRVEAETSFNDARIEQVEGDVRVKVDRGAVKAEAVGGALVAESTHGGVDIRGIRGQVEATVRRGGLVARDLEDGARVRVWDDDVSITASDGSFDVEVQRGDVVLVPARPITEPVTVSADEGAIRLEVPEGSRFDLEAESREGGVNVDVTGLEVTVPDTEADRHVSGSMGGGGARVRLTADGEITLTDGGSAPLPAEQP